MLGSFGRRTLLAGIALVEIAAFAFAATAADDWKARWTEVVAAAEKEGALNVSGPSGKQWRDELIEFQKAYPKIKTEITPAASRDFWPKVMKEREIGQNLWDLRVGGADTQVYELISQNALASVRDMFILPEVADEANWNAGFDHMFTDNARKFAPSFCAYSSPLAHVNTAFVKPDELKTFHDIVDPKWKGKIVMDDPRGGSSAVSMAIVYKKFGPDFIRDLLTKQEVVISTNPRQLMGWFVSGKYPIAMGIPNAAAQQFVDSGVRFEMHPVSGLDIWSVGVCGVQVMEPRPHPNATIVFVNWLLTKDVQARIMKSVRLNSRRKDVEVVDPERAVDWSRIKDYVSGQSEDFYQAMADFKVLTRSILK